GPGRGWERGARQVDRGSRSEASSRAVEPADRSAPLLLLVAMDFEIRYLGRRLGLAPGLPRAGTPSAPGHPGAVLRRIGLAAAARPRLPPGLSALRPSGVLVAGLGGGCAPDVRTGEIVVGRPVGPGGDGGWLLPDAALTDRALAALAGAGLPHRVGPLLTGP